MFKLFLLSIELSKETIIYQWLLFGKTGFEMVKHISNIFGEYCNKCAPTKIINYRTKRQSSHEFTCNSWPNKFLLTAFCLRLNRLYSDRLALSLMACDDEHGWPFLVSHHWKAFQVFIRHLNGAAIRIPFFLSP